MRLQNSPPTGAGKSQGTTKTELLLAHIEGLGTHKVTGNPIGIYVAALSEATGVAATSIPTLLSPYVRNGRVQCCKVTRPGLPPMNEYRRGIGVAIPDFKPLNTKRTHIAHAAGIKPLPVTTPAPTLSTPPATVSEIVTPQFISKTQPEVVAPTFAKTPAAGSSSTPGAAPAVAAAPATPKPTAGAELKKEPATRKASAGDDLRIGINCNGVLVIAIDDDTIELNPKQARKLGHFMSGTAGVWNPL
jgi:hypothetical protein